MATAITGRTPADVERKLERCLLALAVIASFRFWCMPLKSSLWLDEAGTYWTVKDGLPAAMLRVFSAQTTASPIHAALEWAFLKLPGPVEVRLRIPSVLAILLSLLLLYRLGKRLLGSEAALISVCIFMSIGSVIFAGVDGRPYALWLLATIASTLALVEWMDTGGFKAALAFALLASLSMYVQYLAFVMLIVYGAYALTRAGSGAPARPKELVWASLAIAAGALPLLPLLLHLYAQRNLHYYLANTPNVFDLEIALAPPNIVLGMLAGLLAGRLLFSRIRFRATAAAGPVWVLLIAWSTVPPVLLYGLSVLSDAKLFHPRYLVCAAPGTALLAALAIGCIEPARARFAAAAGVLVVALATYGSIRHLAIRHDVAADWRDAIRTVALYADTATPVLVESGFPQSNRTDWLAAGGRDSRMLAPLSVYPVTGTVIPLPMTADHASLEYLKSVVSEKLAVHKRFLLVTSQMTYKLWLDGRLDGIFTSQPVGSSNLPLVFLYERQ